MNKLLPRQKKNRFSGKSQELRTIKRSIELFVKKYGYEMTHYVAERIFEKHREQKKLEREIAKAERELETLRKKKI